MKSQFICFDTEDDAKELQQRGESGFKKRVTQIAAITQGGERYYNRGDVPAFLQWLARRKERFFYAHNLQYDIGNLFGKKLDVIDSTLVGGRLIRSVWGSKTFVDTFNIWPMGAEKLGEAFGLEKLKTDSMATDKEYVFRDVEIIHKAMVFAWQFCQMLGLKYLPATLGGLCVKVWRHWGGDNCHDSTELSREAYYGGRVELFKSNNDCKGGVAWTDINSLYPSVMLNDYPGQLQHYGNQLPEHGIATVSIKVPENDLVVLPFRNDVGRIVFPYGKFTGTYTMPEIRAAVENGASIIKIHDAWGTSEVIRPYSTFVARLYETRVKSESEAEKLFFKLLMNNLYGRLGTKGTIGRSVWQTDKNKFDGVPYGEKVLVEYQMPLAEETNWVHAAYVTAYGRLQLFDYLKRIGTKNLIYCDTDSAIFDCPTGTLPFETGDGLGKMKVIQCCSACGNEWRQGKKQCCELPGRQANSFWPDCEPYLPKLYKAGNVYKAKGVPKRLAKQFFETGNAEFDLPYKMREAIRFYDRKNSRRLSVWHKVQKQRRETYDRKHLQGNVFSPCKVNALGI